MKPWEKRNTARPLSTFNDPLRWGKGRKYARVGDYIRIRSNVYRVDDIRPHAEESGVDVLFLNRDSEVGVIPEGASTYTFERDKKKRYE